ncbi:unnamed protein product [Calypogeia fissa]
MGSDGPVALLALGSIPLGRIDQCRGSEGYCPARYAGPLPSCSGWRSPVKFQDLNGEDYHRATLCTPVTPPRRSSLPLKTGQRLTSKFSTHLLIASAEGSKRRGAGRSTVSVVREDGISALCSSIGLDATRKHPGQLPPSEYGTCSDRCARRISPFGRREMGVIAAATADSDQTLPSQNGGGEKAPPTKPHPEVHPADVVQAQLKALRENDLATVFEFASPTNKARTGPLLRFSEMLEGRAYNVMIEHASADILSTITISSNRFQQRVSIKGHNGKQATFQWSLSRQEEGPYEHCWMTDAVRRDD